MTWVRLEDKFHLNPKIAEAGNAASGLYVRFLSYCADQLTDGFVPNAIARMYGTRRELVTLVAARLVVEVEGGYRIPDYLEYNPTREEVEAEQAKKHEAKVAAGKLGGIASGVARRKHDRSKHEAEGEAEGKQNEAPIPSRPDPIPSLSSRKPSSSLKLVRAWRDDDPFNHTVNIIVQSREFDSRVDDPERWWPVVQADVRDTHGDTIREALTGGCTPLTAAARVLRSQQSAEFAERHLARKASASA